MKTKTDKLIAALLAVSSFGLLGFHWFYLGKNERGQVYIVMTILGVITAPFIFGLFILMIEYFACLVNGVNILALSDEEFNEKYPD